MSDKEYISRQIAVYKTNVKLVEFNDKLNTAPVESYAHIHAMGDEGENGKKVYSTIGIVLQDYTNGKGSKNIRVMANISPDEAQFIFSRMQACVETFDFTADKIFGATDANGYASMTKLKIVRVPVDKSGQKRNYPWTIYIENGKGIKARGSTGGTFCKSGSYICENKAFINLTDLDFYKLLNRVSQYINAWELVFGSAVIKQGRAAIEAAMQQQF
jgi:hypothetical protein